LGFCVEELSQEFDQTLWLQPLDLIGSNVKNHLRRELLEHPSGSNKGSVMEERHLGEGFPDLLDDIDE
jgi:hypothetical protein